jgi:uncharacterized membrane protein
MGVVKLSRLLVTAASLFTVVSLTAPSNAQANTDLIFCNKTGSKIQIAVAYIDAKTNKWMIGSWYTREPGECKSQGAIKTGLFYYYAEKLGADFHWPAKANVDKTYCVPEKGVREMETSTCGAKERRLGFQGKVSTPGKFTFNLS